MKAGELVGMKIADLSTEQLSSFLLAIDGKYQEKEKCSCFWEIGKNYFIRTVTMHMVGKLIAISDKEILLENASWVADSGRFHDAMRDGTLDEVEPFVNDIIVNRTAVIDATVWNHALPTEQK